MTKSSKSRFTTYAARLSAGETAARRIANLIAESYASGETACSAFEGPDRRWTVEAHFGRKPDLRRLRALVAAAGGDDLAKTIKVSAVRPRDWVKDSLINLRPVEAGRFVIHGAHDRDRVPDNRIAIEIEAGLAFGTGHHGTTRGCLMAIDHIARRRRRRGEMRVLDLGTGTGVLAIAAARTLGSQVLAADIDRTSVRVAHDNAVANRAAPLVRCVHAWSFGSPAIRAREPYDLVIANILLNPLRRLAAPLARSLAPHALVVISGLQNEHAPAAISAYRSQGLVLLRRFNLEGWATLMFQAKADWPR